MAPEATTQPTQKNYLLVTLLGSFWNILQFATSFIVAVLSSILLSRYFGADKYGLYSYLTWFSSVVLLVLNFGILTTVQTWVPKYFFTGQLDRARAIAQRLFRVQLIIVAIGAVLIIPLLYFWHTFVSFEPENFTVLMFVNVLPMVANLLNIFLSTLMVSLQRFKHAVLIYITGQILTIVSVLLVIILHLQVLGLLLLLTATSLVMLALFAYYSRDILRTSTDPAHNTIDVKRIASFSGWAYLNIILSSVIWDKSEFFFLGKFASGQAIAVYGIAYALSATVVAILDPVISVFTTILSELVAKKDWDRIRLIVRTCSKYISLLLLPVVTLAYVFSHFVVKLVYGPEFILVASIFPVLLLSITLNRVYAPAWSIPQYMQDLHRVVPRNIVIAVFNIALGLILIPRYGVWGAVLANVTTQVIAVIYFSFFFFVHRYNLRLFTWDYGRVLGLNIALFAVVALVIRPQSSLQFSIIGSLIAMTIYGFLIYKKFITFEDRQLITNAIRAVRSRSTAVA